MENETVEGAEVEQHVTGETIVGILAEDTTFTNYAGVEVELKAGEEVIVEAEAVVEAEQSSEAAPEAIVESIEQ